MTNIEQDTNVTNQAIRAELKNLSQLKLEEVRDGAPINSETYQRAKDIIADVQSNTNNKQVASLANTVKLYKIETDKNIEHDRFLSWVAICIALITPVIEIIKMLEKFPQFRLNLEDTNLILLSVVFPLTLYFKERLTRDIDNNAFLIAGYINKEQLGKRPHYFDYLNALRLGTRGVVKFFTNINVDDLSPLLIPDRSGDENQHIRDCQNQMRIKYNWIKFLSLLQYGVPIAVVAIIILN